MSESITVITLLLSALDRIDLQAVFDRDPYESRRRALPGTRLRAALGLSDREALSRSPRDGRTDRNSQSTTV
jgi:hypothetical protein